MAYIYDSTHFSETPLSRFALIVIGGGRDNGRVYLENEADKEAYENSRDINEDNTELVKSIVTIVAVVAVIFILIKFGLKFFKKKQ